MAFVNVSLLLGGLLVAVPVVLHLVLRQQPKQLVFPALRFLQQRREANRRRLQLRHWLLLALRCAAIGALAFALARPSVNSAAVGNWLTIALLGFAALATAGLLVLSWLQRRGRLLVAGLAAVSCASGVALVVLVAGTLGSSAGIRLGDREAPVSAVLVFETSPRMLYRSDNRTRLEAARDVGLWLIRQLPADSQIAVLDARPGPAVYAVDLAAARKAVERLQTTALARPVPEALDSALQLALAGKHARREVYVLSDLSAASWPGAAPELIRQRLAADPDVAIYVIDVGVERPQNVALGDLVLAKDSLAKNDELTVEADVQATGPGGAVAVELWIEELDRERPVIVDGRPQLPVAARRDRQEVVLPENGRQRARLRVRGLPPGVHQGSVTISGGDPLPVDDVRYFAVAVHEGWPVLVAAPPGVNSSFLTEAIAPAEYRQNQRARFDCTVVEQPQLANQTLDGYAVVCLVDPEPLTPTAWEQLGRYVERGGNLAIFLGYHAQPIESFQSEPARRLLGGKLARQWRSSGSELYLAPRSYEHPVLAPFRPLATSVPWERSPVFRHWVLDELTADAAVVIPYGNGQPALLERPLGKGRVMTMTTPISDPARPRGRAAWNELPTSEDAWPYFVLVNELLLYLAGAGESQLNYLAGETAVLRNDPSKDPPRYQLFTPAEEPQDVQAAEGRLTITFTERPGAYRLKGNLGGPVVRGFAVNLPARATDLTRLPQSELDRLLGEGRYQLARNEKEIVREVGETRVGREFYPYLLMLLTVVLALEHLLANRFYRRQETPVEAKSLEGLARTEGPGTGGSRTIRATPGPAESRRARLTSS